MAAIKISSAKAKARRGQQWVRDRLLELFPELAPDDVRSTPMGVTGEDVQLSPKARALFPFAIECKTKKAFSIYKEFEQADKHKKDFPGLLFIKADRKEPLVVMSADTFFQVWSRK
jgi:hypothetical protein